jgi:2-dehydro-3-deoxygluconokinase
MNGLSKIDEKKYVVAIGEIMLRLKSPGFERLLQSSTLEATFGGGEANVAISLATFGRPTRFATSLPENNPIAQACVNFLHAMYIDTSCIVRQGDRIGIYYLETGSGPRPSRVIYDRSGSSISMIKYTEFPWVKIFDNAVWLHITGITPAISQSAAELTMFAMKAAKERGLKISFDLNYRKNLWKWGKNPIEVITSLMPFVDVVIANEEDIQKTLGLDFDQKGLIGIDPSKYEDLASKVLTQYPNVSMVAITLRESYSADNNAWSGMLRCRDIPKAFFSKKYALTDIVDRVGGGDSFAGGLIYALMEGMPFDKAIDFATAASALKHTIPGDANRVSKAEVLALLGGDNSGRVQR